MAKGNMKEEPYLNRLIFETFQFTSRREVLIGIDTTNKYVIKIQVIKNKNKRNDIYEEYEIIKYLNDKRCVTCPIVYEKGKIKKNSIISKEIWASANVHGGPGILHTDILDSISDNEFKYIIQEFIPDNGAFTFADIMLALVEQKKLGVYHGDVKPANIRFSPVSNICYFIDYDQAMFLNNEQINLDNVNFLHFCSQYDKDKYGFGNWSRHFPQYKNNDIMRVFNNKALDLEQTTVFKTQKTTNTINGIYHSINEQDIYINGSRTVSSRSILLDEIKFEPNETVLDIGCNSGLLCTYLHDRGCNVTGADVDPHIIIACKIISNILGKDINYLQLDLDKVKQIDDFDTVVLFSVLHHTRDPVENAKKLINSCSRILLEVRLEENGKQLVDGEWSNTTRWSFNTIDELISYCESMFKGFKLRANLGKADKNRYIFEFVK